MSEDIVALADGVYQVHEGAIESYWHTVLGGIAIKFSGGVRYIGNRNDSARDDIILDCTELNPNFGELTFPYKHIVRILDGDEVIWRNDDLSEHVFFDRKS